MLSAVESSGHLATGRPYPGHHHHHHAHHLQHPLHHPYGASAGMGNATTDNGATMLPISTYPSNVVPPSTSEFVKPHPKLRYHSLPSRGGIPSSTPKYKYSAGDQQPVNLAVGNGNVTNNGSRSGSPISNATTSPSSSAAVAAAAEKLKTDFEMMKSAGIPVNLSEFIYGHHPDLGYQPLNYSANFNDAVAVSNGSKNGMNGPSLKVNGVHLGRSNSDGLAAYHHHGHHPRSTFLSQAQPPPPPMHHSQKFHDSMHAKVVTPPSELASPNPGQLAPNTTPTNGLLLSPDAIMSSHHRLQNYHLQAQQMQHHLQNNSKVAVSNGTFMIPPQIMPSTAELEAYHAAYQNAAEATSRYYKGQGLLAPPPPPPPTSTASSQQQLQQPHHPSRQSSSPGQMQLDLSAKGAIDHQHSNNHHHQHHHQQQHHHSHPSNTPSDVRSIRESRGQDKNNNIGFKVPPSGKEGPLKHRILRTPNGEAKESKKKSSKNKTTTVGTQNIVKSNFNKGILIELGNGELKRVEDMRTEDFILSSNTSAELELIDTTILKIVMLNKSLVVITLSVPSNKSKVDLTVGAEHPFFVCRQGWASCNPDGTYQMHGLKCQRLEVGDVCISLRQKDRHHDGIVENMKAVRIESGAFSSSSSSSSSTTSSLSSPPLPPTMGNDPVQQQPQNLSCKPSSQLSPATCGSSSAVNRGMIEGHIHHPSINKLVHLTTKNAYEHAAASVAKQQPYSSAAKASEITHSIKNIVMGDDERKAASKDGYYGSMAVTASDYSTNAGASSSSSNTLMAPSNGEQGSHKRRWSAPDNMGDSDGEQPQQRQHLPPHSGCSSAPVGSMGRGNVYDDDEPPIKIPSH